MSTSRAQQLQRYPVEVGLDTGDNFDTTGSSLIKPSALRNLSWRRQLRNHVQAPLYADIIRKSRRVSGRITDALIAAALIESARVRVYLEPTRPFFCLCILQVLCMIYDMTRQVRRDNFVMCKIQFDLTFRDIGSSPAP